MYEYPDCDDRCDFAEPGGRSSLRAAMPANFTTDNNLGVGGVWLVGQSRDRVQAFESDGLRGFYVYNCCGSWTVAVRID